MPPYYTIVDWTQCRGQWIALDRGTEAVLAHAASVEELLRVVELAADPIIEYGREDGGGWLA